MYDLSVSIVSYNNKKDIKQCLDSFFSIIDSKLKCQVFIINNSQLESLEVLSTSYPIKIIQMSKNLGFGQGHNVVLPMLNSRYHTILINLFQFTIKKMGEKYKEYYKRMD